MHFTFLLTICLSSLVLASSVLIRRDVAPILDALSSIATSLKDLQDTATAFDGDVLKASDILSKYDELLVNMGKQEDIINALDPLRVRDAVPILEPASAMSDLLESVVDTLISKKQLFDQNELTPVVQDTFVKGKKAAADMIDSIIKKLPKSVKPIGDGIGKQLYSLLDKGIKAFTPAPASA